MKECAAKSSRSWWKTLKTLLFWLVVAGVTGLICGVVNCPLASILLSVELFGSSHILFFALACTLSYLISGKFSLYSSQKIIYSKLEPQFIDEYMH